MTTITMNEPPGCPRTAEARVGGVILPRTGEAVIRADMTIPAILKAMVANSRLVRRAR
jgi:hypothetical protein